MANGDRPEDPPATQKPGSDDQDAFGAAFGGAPPGRPGAVREQEPAAAADEDVAGDATPAAPRRAGRALALFALLVGLGALGLGGYLYYELVYREPSAPLESRLVDLEVRVQERQSALETMRQEQKRTLDEFAQAQRREREASEQRLLETVNELASRAPPSRREWKVAEVAYLLRIANHRLLMERDVGGALTLLKAADAILVELDDFALFQVRAQLADEILSLENVKGDDIQGLFLRLEAIKTEVSRQSLKLPRFQVEKASTPEVGGFWESLKDQLGSYLRFRRFDGATVKPLLAPEEAVYLELNLRLMLERAQLAALRRDQVIYQQSLETAGDWISTYLDQDDPTVRRSIDELRALGRIELDRPLPDISGSLKALKSLGEA